MRHKGDDTSELDWIHPLMSGVILSLTRLIWEVQVTILEGRSSFQPPPKTKKGVWLDGAVPTPTPY